MFIGLQIFFSARAVLKIIERSAARKSFLSPPFFSLAVFRALSQRTERVEEATPVLRGVGKLPQSFVLVEVGLPNN